MISWYVLSDITSVNGSPFLLSLPPRLRSENSRGKCKQKTHYIYHKDLKETSRNHTEQLKQQQTKCFVSIDNQILVQKFLAVITDKEEEN